MPDISVGSGVGPYRIVKELPQGRGGMARVYVGAPETEEDGQYRVALKVARTGDEGTSKSPSAQRFYYEALSNEVEMLRRLKHPNIVQVYPIPVFEGQRKNPYIARATLVEGAPWFCAMEYLEGNSLKDYIRQRKKLNIKEAVEIACQVGLALDYLHAKDIAHLDVKPDNVLFRYRPADGGPLEPVLIDFGVARGVKKSGLDAGSLPYMAPERLRLARGEIAPEQMIDQRPVDVYALGVLLYRMLTGHLPFEGKARESITSAILNQTPTRPSQYRNQISFELETVILRVLDKNPERRPGITDMIEMLNEAVPPPRSVARTASDRREQAGESKRQSPSAPVWLLSTLILVALVAGMLLGWRSGDRLFAALARSPTPTSSLVAPLIATATAQGLVTMPTRTRETVPAPTATNIPVSTPTRVPTFTQTATATLAPTATLTRRPDDTPTAIPTYTPTQGATGTLTSPTNAALTPATTKPSAAPGLIAPVDGESFTGWNARVVLQWEDVGRLAADDYYVIRIPYDPAGNVAEFWRKDTSFLVPSNFSLPSVGFEDRLYRWTVQVMRCTLRCDQVLDDNTQKQGEAQGPRSVQGTFYWHPDIGGPSGPSGSSSPLQLADPR